jgi:putative FmdB family regulatory protein
MPIYLYVCRDCSEVTETIRPTRDRDEPILCEKCQGIADRTLHGQTPQGFWFAPPTHLKQRVERTAHNINARKEGTRVVETN